VFSWLVFLANEVLAVSSGYPGSVGIMSAIQSEDTGFRQSIELSSSSGMLVGRPNAGPVALISIYAPNIGASQVLLREIRLLSGDLTFLLTGPSSLESATRRATLFVRKDKPQLALWEWIDGAWKSRPAQSIPLAQDTANTMSEQTEITAFSVERLGLYLLWSSDFPKSGNGYLLSVNPNKNTLLGGSIFRSLLPGLSALFAMILGILLSVWWHKREQKG